jgi:hypothetical protein
MVLETINLFPESRYLRCRNRPDFDHKCGGIVSLFILTALFALLVVKLIECFTYATVFFKQATIVETDPRNATVRTQIDNPNIAPYMIAVRPQNTCINQTTVIAYFIDRNGPNSNLEKITLEQCTRQHFSKL